MDWSWPLLVVYMAVAIAAVSALGEIPELYSVWKHNRIGPKPNQLITIYARTDRRNSSMDIFANPRRQHWPVRISADTSTEGLLKLIGDELDWQYNTILMHTTTGRIIHCDEIKTDIAKSIQAATGLLPELAMHCAEYHQRTVGEYATLQHRIYPVYVNRVPYDSGVSNSREWTIDLLVSHRRPGFEFLN